MIYPFNFFNLTKMHLNFTCILVSILLSVSLSGRQEESNVRPVKAAVSPNQEEPLKIAVVGLVHDHVNWILGRKKMDDIEMVAIVEPNRELAEKYATRYGFSLDMVYPSLEAMYEKVKPEAVTAFNAIFDHLAVVEFCAPRGIHVMVEKPLAVSVAHAQKMIQLADEHDIRLITNYETTWYASNKQAYRWIREESKIGFIRKMVFYTGHQGPREIGCSEEFLSWLTDPVLNGAGALTDFGCYGSNLATWFMEGKPPLSVTCLTKQVKPDIYPRVDDDATIVLTYPEAEVIIQASWNWPFGRKEMEVYGQSGYIFCKNARDMSLLEEAKKGAQEMQAPSPPDNINDPFHYLFQVIKRGYQEPPYNLSSPENNLMVVQILEAAKASARLGKTLLWTDLYQ